PSSSFYAALWDSGPDRIVQVNRQGNLAIGLPVTWKAVPIAGMFPEPGAFPSNLNVTGVTVQGILADPKKTDTLFVGTSRGMFGGQQASGTWTWSLSPDIPAYVTSVLNNQLNSDLIRASSYGRSSYQLMRRSVVRGLAKFKVGHISFAHAGPLPWAV